LPLIPREKIDDVRERTNLVEVIKRHVELKRAGTGSWKGLCPFHAEKTPSFNVREQQQYFHCFGCGEKGDVFAFLTKIEQRSFMEVLRDLAQQAGVELPEKQMTPAERQAHADAESEKERMLRTMEAATAFFEAQLATPAGDAARAYLTKRGISPETAKRFRVGYAPSGWDVLQRHLKQIPVDLLTRLGLVGVNERGNHYDFFRDRVMLPVLDRQKRPLGYSSRLLDPDAKDRKYVNSPDSPLFHKKENLYGLHAALDAIRKSKTAVVVEGNFDVMSLHEAGIEEAVAPMGTALTTEQVGLLGRLAQRVVVVFDGDEAGQRAARKALPLFLDSDTDGRVARMPTKVDPDDFVRSQGAEAFRKLVENARPVVDQYIDDLARENDGAIPSRVQDLEAAAEVLLKVRNPLERDLYVSRLAKTFKVDKEQLLRAMRGASAATPRAAQDAAPAPVSTTTKRTPPKEQLEALVLVMTHPELAALPEAQRIQDLLVDPGVSHIYRIVLEALRRGDRADVPAWLDAGPADIREAVGTALMNGGYDAAEAAGRAIRALKTRLELSSVTAEIELWKVEQKKALEQGDSPQAQAIMQRQMELLRKKQELTVGLARP
jgi:DNA primase